MSVAPIHMREEMTHLSMHVPLIESHARRHTFLRDDQLTNHSEPGHCDHGVSHAVPLHQLAPRPAATRMIDGLCSSSTRRPVGIFQRVAVRPERAHHPSNGGTGQVRFVLATHPCRCPFVRRCGPFRPEDCASLGPPLSERSASEGANKCALRQSGEAARFRGNRRANSVRDFTCLPPITPRSYWAAEGRLFGPRSSAPLAKPPKRAARF